MMELKALLQNKYKSEAFEQFLKERFLGLEILESRATSNYLSDSERKNIENYRFLGKVELDDGKEIGFFEFLSTSEKIENKRVGYNAVLKKLAKEEILDGAIASFYHPNSNAWRLSFVGFEYDEGKAKDITALKRYTYVVGEGIPTKTAYIQLKQLQYPTFDEIEQAFSVEAVTDEFYKSYKALFEKLNEELYPQQALFSYASDPEAEIRKFNRKLLGRITFLYFLQKKGWLGVQKKWGDGDKNFLQNIYKNHPENFYLSILKPLFFTAMNTPRQNDYYEPLKCKIPFLNGGLFTKEKSDGIEVILSDTLFGEIFETFNQYNFTIIEDLPHDSEVAIDPEMLGRVFENLIEENYRASRGAFYTPREIVHYMCRQSIVMYLSKHFDKKAIEDLVIREITDTSYIKKHAKQIKEKLLSIKVLDPAIGSGAFPMGILHEIVKIIENLNKADNTSKEKKQIIENSIYGVDIDGSAVDIAKLRFWLSIIVDEEEPFPLPNLAFKIMQGNSLIETIDGFSPIPQDMYAQTKPKKTSLFDEEHTLFYKSRFDVLKEHIHAFYNTYKPKEKEKLLATIKDEVKELIVGYIDQKEQERQHRQKELDAGLNATNRERVWNEIGRLQGTIAKARNVINEMLENNFQTTELFLYKLWFGEVMKEGGFDLVIGNPPYLRVQGIDKNVSETYKTLFSSATGSYDLYVLFVEKGLELLNEQGTLNYIMPHKWVNSAFGKGLRHIVNTHVKRLISFDAYQVFNASTYTSLLWLSKQTVGVMEYIQLDKDLQTNKDLERYLSSLSEKDFTHIDPNDLSETAWVLTDKATYEILQKLKSHPRTVGDVFKKIFQGIATSKDSVYFLKQCKRQSGIVKGYSEELEKYVEIEEGLTKPLLKGDDVHRYELLYTDKVVIFPYYLTVDEKGREKAELFSEEELKKKFPKGYAYLKACEDVLRGREKGRLKNDDFWYRYIYPKNLTLFHKEKIITPYLSYGSQLSYDVKGEFYTNTKCFGLIKKANVREGYKFHLAILNSKLTWYFICNTSSVMRGGYFTYTKDSLSPFPLPKIENILIANTFETLVDYIMWLKANKESHINDYVSNDHIAKEFESVIDAMVYELYFEEELHAKELYFIQYALELFKPIEGLEKEKQKEIIHQAYQTLRERENPIRNNLMLLTVRLKNLIVPIERSI